MTLVVGIKLRDGRVMMGADSFVGADGDSEWAVLKKVRRHQNILIGASGMLASVDFYLHLVEIPKYSGGDQHRWVVREFGNAVRAALREHSLAAADVAGDAIIAVGGELFAFEGRIGTHGFADDYAAIGSGQQWAQGSLEATKGLTPRVRILKALRAAAKYSGSIQPPWTFVTGGA